MNLIYKKYQLLKLISENQRFFKFRLTKNGKYNIFNL